MFDLPAHLLDAIRPEDTPSDATPPPAPPAAAFAALWHGAYPDVYAVCLAILRHPADAEDTAVYVLEKFLLRVVPSGCPGDLRAAGGYLRTMAVHQSLRVKKKLAREVPHDLSDKDVADALRARTPRERGSMLDPNTVDADQAALRALAWGRLGRCLEGLTPRARLALTLKTQRDGISDREIGEILGVSKVAVGKSLKKSKEVLRACLERRLPQ